MRMRTLYAFYLGGVHDHVDVAPHRFRTRTFFILVKTNQQANVYIHPLRLNKKSPVIVALII